METPNERTHVESYSEQKSVKQTRIWFMFYNLKEATFCFDDNLLLAFCQSASWGSHLEGFYNSLKGVPRGAVYFSAATPSLGSSTHPKPSPSLFFLVW